MDMKTIVLFDLSASDLGWIKAGGTLILVPGSTAERKMMKAHVRLGCEFRAGKTATRSIPLKVVEDGKGYEVSERVVPR